MGLSRGLRGTICTVCNKGVIKTQDALTCSPECGAKKKAGYVAPSPAASAVLQDLHIPFTKFKPALRQQIEAKIARAEFEALRLAAAKVAPRYVAIKRPRLSGNMLELNIPDLHVGKLAWAKETGYENYDTNIAIAVYHDALKALIARTDGYKYDKILLVIGNDLLNSDNLMNATTKGTVVTTDVRFQKTFAKVREMMVETIERLREIAPVEVVMVPGNHDTLSVWHLGDSLECWFRNCPDVTVENAPTPRKYVQFGKVMLMFTHGDKVRKENLPMLFATEQAKMFGATAFREIHTGHTHQVRLDENHGIRTRVFPSLCSPDDWHADLGYVGNIRSAEAFVWNAEEGLIIQATYSVPTPRIKAAGSGD